MLQIILIATLITIIMLCGYTVQLTHELGKMENRIDQKLKILQDKLDK